MGKDQDLIDAARNGNIALVCKILEHITKRSSGPLSSFRRGPSINAQDVNGYTALHHACLNGHSNIVRLLLSHEATPDVPDIRGSTPLYVASWAGHHEIVKMLLLHPQKPANPNAQTIENETPLHCAAQHGHNTALAILLAHGADPTIRNNSFQTALELAAQFGRLQAVNILISTHPELIEPYRKKKGRSATKHIFTHTCLHLASRNGHKKVVEALLAVNIDVNVLTHAGTALHEAALCGKKTVVSTLLHAGVDINAIDGNGRTAMDILAEYPPHVTYEIVSIINDFSKKINSEKYFKPITEAIEENDANSDEVSTPVEKISPINEKKPKCTVKPNAMPITKNLSNSLNSLNKATILPENYLKMKPISWQKSDSDLLSSKENVFVYKPVYKQTTIGGSPQNGFFKASKQANTTGSESETNSIYSNRSTPIRSYRCVDEYVEMSEPKSISPEQKFLPNISKQKKPLPSPRTHQAANYENISFSSKDSTIEERKCQYSMDANNNKDHSPTPEFPPPSVSQAELTILEFIQPPTKKNKRKSLRIHENGSIDFDYYMNENFDRQFSTDSPTSSSRISDCIEEYKADQPFAGLFRGSTLNLVENGTNIHGIELPSGLRSPSLVKSVLPVPAKRNVEAKTEQRETIVDFNETKEWDEINNILESIGKEVLDANEIASKEDVTTINNSVNMRNPSELTLNNSITESNASPANWCHSPNALIYGQIVYNVFYLGSTVIRELHGTASTRKSIQRFKFDESPKDDEINLLEDCNTSTKYLKMKNQEKRLKVGISFSHRNVKFCDVETQSTICVHDIQNINCVCQDAEDLRYFAYITKENDMHYCHVFMVDSLNLATEIILTLGQAFEVAYQLAISKDIKN